MTAQTTITTATPSTSPSSSVRARLLGALLVGGLCGSLLLGGWALRHQERGAATSPAPPAATPGAARDSAAEPVLYLLGTEADRAVVAAFTTQLNRDRQGRGLAPLADELVVEGDGATDADAQAVPRLAFLRVWQTGRGQALRVADLR